MTGFLSDPPYADEIGGVRWLGPTSSWTEHAARGAEFHLGFGSTIGRRRWADAILGGGGRLASIVHPAAVIAASAQIGVGAFVAASATLASGAAIGTAAIVNHGAVVEHDSRIGAYALVGPAFACGGRVTLEEGVMAGVGSRVVPDAKIARWCWLGAGAVVTRDTAPHGLYAGVPARRIRDLGTDAAPMEPTK